jgi:hypothetical protein
VISLPFNKDYNTLEEKERLLFLNAIEERIKSYLGFSNILSEFVTGFG